MILKKNIKYAFVIIIFISFVIFIISYHYNDNELNLLTNKNVDVVCSGPSSENIKLKSDIVICANSSILNKSINKKNLNKKIIWIMGPGYRLDNIIDNFDNHYIVKEYLNNLKVIPDYFIVEYAGDKTLDKYNYLKKKMIELYPKIIVKNIKPYRYSTGSACIQYALENNVNNIYLSGYMDWLKSEYKYNSDFASIDLYKNKNLKILHGEEDKKYIKLLKKSDKKKIITDNKEMKKFLI